MRGYFLILVATITTHLLVAECKVLTCYVMFWSAYRQKAGKFLIDYIDPKMCTHIIYGYNRIKAKTMEIKPLDPSADFLPGLGNFKRLQSLKDENPYLKILVSLGGWSEGSTIFSTMVQSSENRTKFINEALKFLSVNQLDGLDFDWQHPTQGGGKSEDRNNFPTFLEEVRRAFDPFNYILSVRLVGMRYYIDPGYDVKRISNAVHYINLRTFGYHMDWQKITGIHAALLSDDEDNVGFSVRYMLKKGAHREKLLLGLRTGGSAVLMTKSSSGYNNHEGFLQKPVSGKFSGTLTEQPGFFGFNDYCWETYGKQPWQVFWHNYSSTPYAVLGKKFISFDNKHSVKLKLKLVDMMDLGGVSIYSVDTDDFKGYCYNQTFPITKAARDFLFGVPPPITFSSSIVSYSYPDNA